MGFKIDTDYGDDIASSTISAAGEYVSQLSPDQYAIFGLSDAILKRAIKAFFGTAPDDVYLSDPTPDNWYETNGWEPVSVLLRPVKSEIVEMSREKTILHSQVFTNTSSFLSNFDVGLSKDVSEDVGTTWSQSISIGIDQSVDYGTKFIRGSTSISFQTDFQEGGSRSRSVSIGQSSGVGVAIPPGNSVRATLTAFDGKAKSRVTFEAILRGIVVGYYKSIYKRKHVWPIDIAGALEAIDKSNQMVIVNEINADYFSGGEIVVEDLP